METVSEEAEGIRFDPFQPDFFRDPYRVYRELRERAPVHRAFGMWVLTRYQDIVTVLKDRRFSSRLFPDTVRRFRPVIDDPRTDYIDGFMRTAIVFTEEPEHSRLRRLVRTAFDHRTVEAERPHIRGIVQRLVGELVDRPMFDAIDDLADLVPLNVNCDRLGLPQDMRTQVRDWAHDVRFLLDPGLLGRRDYHRLHRTIHEFADYLRGEVDRRRRHPTDDVICRFMNARDGDEKLTDDEVILLCMMTFVAGHETTKYLIGNGIIAFCRHPEQGRRLAVDPGLMKSAVDEVLRFDCPLQQTKRLAEEDVEVAGVPIQQGDKVLVCLGSGNRDPERFEDPDRFDIARSDRGQLGLGWGMRACLGGTMAHVEAQETFVELTRRFERLEVDEASLDWQNKSRILRGVDHLPVHVRGRGRA